MRNYWTRIALGALAIFVVGMVGLSLVRRSVGGVRAVTGGSGPITLPVMFVPFKLHGEKLGTVSRVVLHRDAPKRIKSVELTVKLNDSVLARGLEGCRLAANLDFDQPATTHGGGIDVGPMIDGVFSCLPAGDTTSAFQEFGHVVFQPGDVSVPLLLPSDIVTDLKQGDVGPPELNGQDADSVEAAAEAVADSIADAAETRADSIAMAAEERTRSAARTRRFLDSLRAEGLRRADSTRRMLTQMADSMPSR